MKPFRFFFRFTKDQQKGIMVLFVLIIVIQLIYFIISNFSFTTDSDISKNEKEWLSHQNEIEQLKKKHSKSRDTIYPFNPNYLTDYKGYLLGLSSKQIDLLLSYRKSGKYVNNPEEFQKVTGIADTLLVKLTPYFKFGNRYDSKSQTVYNNSSFKNTLETKVEKQQLIDINDAVEEDLIKVYGIGPYYAKAILKRRSALGAFVNMEQMNEFAEFSPEAKAGLKKSFAIISSPQADKINVNTASLQQLSRFYYFNKDIARNIITKRSMDGKIFKIDDLLEIKDFPVDKVKIIALYLEF